MHVPRTSSAPRSSRAVSLPDDTVPNRRANVQGAAPERTHRGDPAPGSGRADGPQTGGRGRCPARCPPQTAPKRECPRPKTPMNRGETVYAEEPHPFHFDDPIPYVSVPQGKRGRLAAVPLVHEALAARPRIHRRRRLRDVVDAQREQVDPHGRAESEPGNPSPCTRYATPSRLGSGAPEPTWRTSRTCTDTPTRPQRGSTRRRRSPSSAMRSGGCVP